MNERLGEALLEMAYFAPLAKLFEEVLGRAFLRVFKPSQQDEVFVGFDQAWAPISATTHELVDEIGKGLRTGVRPGIVRFGYFLQFKSPTLRERSSSNTPSGASARYFEAILSTKPAKKGALPSQHETLRALHRLGVGDVSYAVPCLESSDHIFGESAALLDRLVVLNVSSSPGGWLPGSRHAIIATRDLTRAFWHSEPVDAEPIDRRAWASRVSTGEVSWNRLWKTAREHGTSARAALTLWEFGDGEPGSDQRAGREPRPAP